MYFADASSLPPAVAAAKLSSILAMTGYEEILTAPSSLSEAISCPHDTENLFVGFVVAIKEKQEK